MAEVRQRKPANANDNKKAPSNRHNSPNRATQDPILGTNSPLLTLIFGPGILLALLAYGGYHFYNNSTFSQANSNRKPLTARNAETQPPPSSSPSPASQLHLTDSALRPHDGTNPDLPLYLAINGTIYDVSASPSFYGPGGPYGHFAGRDASRAWVTECWDDEAQLTWDMSGVEEMFTPRWMDEEMEEAAEGKVAGETTDEDEGMKAMVVERARAVVEKLGKVGAAEREKRRVRDSAEASEAVGKALAHWVGFFDRSAKYRVVGTVDTRERSEGAGVPPICEQALKKRPIKGGKLQGIIDAQAPGMAGGAPDGEAKKPEFVRGAVKE
ncbi:hypothetical protein MBLNU230_g3277t1 [Neophaeotheca triangularis]